MVSDMNTITLTDEQMAALQAGRPITIEPPKAKAWPKLGQQYYFKTSRGGIGCSYWLDDTFDNAQAEIGNVFKSEEEAEKYIGFELLEALHAWNSFVKKANGDWVADYFCYTQDKFYPEISEGGVQAAVCRLVRSFVGLHCATREICHATINHLGEERVRLLLNCEGV